MDHGAEAARPTTVGSTDLGMDGAVQGGDSVTFPGQGGAAVARGAGVEPTTVAAYNNSAEFARLVRAAVLVDPQLPGRLVPAHHDYGYSARQPLLGAGRGVVLVDLLYGGAGAVYNGDYMLLPNPGAGHGEALVDLLPDGAGVVYRNYMVQPSPAAGHGDVFVGLLPDGAGHVQAFVGQLPRGSGAVYGDNRYFALQPRPGAGHGEVLVDLLPDGAGHGEVLVDLLPNGAGHGEVFVDLLPAGGDSVHDDYGVDMVYGDPGMPATHLRRLLAFIGIGASSVAVNGLAAGPGSPAVAFQLFVLLLAGLLLVILHVLRV